MRVTAGFDKITFVLSQGGRGPIRVAPTLLSRGTDSNH